MSKIKKNTTPLAETEADTQRLIHELQVHQIELEMQNEELVETHGEIEGLLRQYTDLYDFAPVGYFTLAPDSTIIKTNLTGAKMLDLERSRLINRRLGLFVSSKSRLDFNAYLAKLFSTSDVKASSEFEFKLDGNAKLWARMDAVLSEDGQECNITLVDITERILAEERLRYISAHDALTGLYNRAFFMEQMALLERGRRYPVSIVIADVDQLKVTNDQYGHAAGDGLLKRVAQVMTVAFRKEDMVARIGGDEFAVLLPTTDTTTGKILIHRVKQVLLENNAAHPGSPLSLSLGVSTAMQQTSLINLLRDADANMYLQKRQKKN